MAEIKLKDRREVAQGTMAFYFSKPTGFSYQAGQFGDFTIADPPETDAKGNSRAFTLASAPYEEDLMIATRMRDSAFKRSLTALPLGTSLRLDAPSGELTLHAEPEIPAVLLCGGIGVTPMRSMIRQATHEGLSHRLILFYANRRPEDAAFLDELTQAEERNPQFTLVATMTGMEKSGRTWQGQTGRVTAAMIRESVPDLSRPIYYLSGPGEMLAAMRQILEDAGVDEGRVRTERFPGY